MSNDFLYRHFEADIPGKKRRKKMKKKEEKNEKVTGNIGEGDYHPGHTFKKKEEKKMKKIKTLASFYPY